MGNMVIMGWVGSFCDPGQISLIKAASLSTAHRLCSLQVKAMEVDVEERPKELVRKPYVLNGGCRPYSSGSLWYLTWKGPLNVFIL